MKLSQEQTERNITLIENGTVLRNVGVPNKTLAFKLWGKYYTTAPKRTRKYRFDNPMWEPYSDCAIFRVWLVFSGTARRIGN